MEIIKTSKDLTPQEVYFLTMSPTVQKMSDAESQIIEVESWALYEDENSKGEIQSILAIKTPEGEVFATNSATFKEDFVKMNELFNGMGVTVNAIKVSSGTSKLGRKFITCVYEN
jgi:hypothetical protein